MDNSQQHKDTLTTTIRDAIKSIARPSRFIDRSDSGAFSHELAQILGEIDNNLLLHYPSDALTALDAFLSLDKKIMNRCDDSNGSISDEFRYAVDLWGRAWNNLPDFDAHTLVKALEKRITSNSYGLFDNIVPAAGAALKKKGLDELEQLMRSHYAQNKELFYAYNTLRDIALLRESPEAFKEVFELGNYKGTVSDQLDLARLLIKAQRTEEAIQLLETIDDTSHYGAPSLDLLIEIYDAVKNISAAQRLRWRGVYNTQ